jgi:hypothetical protein
MQLYSTSARRAFFQITEAAIKWLNVQLEKLKYGALKNQAVVLYLWACALINFVSGTAGELFKII